MNKLILFIALGLLAQSCVNFTNIQSARTLGPTREKDQYIYTRVTTVLVDNEMEGVFIVPEFVYKKRIKNNLDWGFKIGLDARVTGQLKYQFVGNNHSKFAMSIMPETGLSLFPVSDNGSALYKAPIGWQSEIPILMTFHFNDNFYFTSAPKIMNYLTPKGNYLMSAISSGFQFGKKVNWTIAYSFYHTISTPTTTTPIFDDGHIFEIGLKFNLFKNGKTFAPRFNFD